MEATALKEQTEERPKAYKFSLKTPYMEQGRVTQLVGKTDNMWIHTKINAEGGENAVHCHLDEDHSFIVLEGQMSVFDEKGNEMKLEKYQGVMIPCKAYYRYLNTGEGNLVVLRIGSGINAKPQGGDEMRTRPDGKPLPAGSAENLTLPPIEMKGKFFAESAG